MTDGGTPGDFNEDSKRIISAIKAGRQDVLKDLYQLHRPNFLNWAKKKYYGSNNNFEEFWCESIAYFFENVMSGKLTDLRCEVHFYLFGIGDNLLKKYHSKRKGFTGFDEIENSIKHVNYISEDPWEEERLILRAAIKKLSPKCRELLDKRYYHDLTIDELRILYKRSPNHISSDISQCRKKLEKIIETMLNQQWKKKT